MANLMRGQVRFRATGRELYLQYGTREIAEAQGALGFHRPNPQQPDVLEEVDVALHEKGKPKLDAAGRPTFRREQVLVDAAERQRRMIAAFEACLLNPDPAASVSFLRIGLRPWQRDQNVKLEDGAIERIVDELGFTKLRLLHVRAVSLGSYLTGDEVEEEDGEGKAASAGPAASST
jgi:hypothetical protein